MHPYDPLNVPQIVKPAVKKDNNKNYLRFNTDSTFDTLSKWHELDINVMPCPVLLISIDFVQDQNILGLIQIIFS